MLEEDIKHCKKVLENWHGCNECKTALERLLGYMKELLAYRKAKDRKQKSKKLQKQLDKLLLDLTS